MNTKITEKCLIFVRESKKKTGVPAEKNPGDQKKTFFAKV